MHKDLLHAAAAIRTATSGLTPDQLEWHPEGKWSSAGILEHLVKTYSTTAYILDRCLAHDTPKARPDKLRQRIGAWIVLDVGYFPTGVKAPEITRPVGMSAAAVVPAAEDALRNLDEVSGRAEARFGPRTKLANHPILGAFDINQWRRFHRVHTRHHMKQIAHLRRQL